MNFRLSCSGHRCMFCDFPNSLQRPVKHGLQEGRGRGPAKRRVCRRPSTQASRGSGSTASGTQRSGNPAAIDAEELLWHDADHRKRLAGQAQIGSDDGPRPPEAPAPECIAEHGHAVWPRRSCHLRERSRARGAAELPVSRRTSRKTWCAVTRFNCPPSRSAGCASRIAKTPARNAVVPAQEVKDGAGQIRHHGSTRGRADELHQPLRVFHRQSPQQHHIHQAEQSGVGADSEGQREQRDPSECRRVLQCPAGVAQVLPQRLQRSEGPQLAARFRGHAWRSQTGGSPWRRLRFRNRAFRRASRGENASFVVQIAVQPAAMHQRPYPQTKRN